MSTRAQLLAEVTTSFPNNTTGAITPAILSTQQNDVINSCWIPATDGTPLTSATGTAGITGTAGQVLANGATSQQFGSVTLTLASALTGINSVTSAAATDHTINAGSGNQNVVLSPSGTGFVRAGATVTTETAGTVAWQFTGSINNFYQGVLQNTSALGTASTDLVLYNDQVSGANPTTHYLDLGKNSSGFSGAGPINIASGSYLYEQTDDLSVGVVGNTTLHLFANNADVAQLTGTAVSLPSTVSGGLKVYNTSDQTTNFERFEALWTGNIATYRTVNGGSGTIRAMRFGDATLTNFVISPQGSSSGQFQFNPVATSTAGNIGAAFVVGVNSAGSGTNVGLSLSPSYNQSSGTAANTDLKIARTETALGSSAQYFIQLLSGASGTTDRWHIDNFGVPTQTTGARSSGVASYFTLNAAADTGITASTESIGFNVVGATRTWADGTVASQREYLFQAPTYNKTTTSATFTKAATLAVSAAPISGAGVTITNPYAFWVQSGSSQFDGNITSSGAINGSQVRISGNASQGAWLLNGLGFASGGGVTYNDTTSSGTVPAQTVHAIQVPTMTATSSTTYTDSFTWYFAGPPTASTNVVQTRAHTLGIVDSTSAASSITGGLVVATTLGTSATSVGIGGGNVNAGGLITGGTVTSTGLLTSGSHTLTGAAGTTALTIAQTARTSGVLPYIKWTIPTDTAQTASTESPGVQVVTGTRTWATTGTVALQREIFFAGPTYASASASQTFTDAFNVYITPPVAGSNAIFTRGHSLGIVDATSATTAITGGFVLATTLGTAATSIGMGGGNIVAGGNIFASTSTGRIGYLAGSGAGGAVTQLTSRVTGVTLNTPTGQITLFAAAGSATAATFTVTCSAVAATDTIYLSQVSGTNLYETFVTAVGAGSFNITFFTTGGTASDSPVFNYTVVKGSAS